MRRSSIAASSDVEHDLRPPAAAGVRARTARRARSPPSGRRPRRARSALQRPSPTRDRRAGRVEPLDLAPRGDLARRREAEEELAEELDRRPREFGRRGPRCAARARRRPRRPGEERGAREHEARERLLGGRPLDAHADVGGVVEVFERLRRREPHAAERTPRATRPGAVGDEARYRRRERPGRLEGTQASGRRQGVISRAGPSGCRPRARPVTAILVDFAAPFSSPDVRTPRDPRRRDPPVQPRAPPAPPARAGACTVTCMPPPTGSALAARPRRARRRLRRHRHEPALRAQGVLQRARTASRPTPANVLGVLSLIFWSLTFVVAVKYLAFIMRADNRGEGGILALLALVRRQGERGAAPAALLAHRSGCSARRCSTATASSRRRSRCSARSRASRSRHPALEPLRRAADASASCVALFVVQTRGTGGRRGVRSDHARLVRRDRRARRPRHRRTTRRCSRRSNPRHARRASSRRTAGTGSSCSARSCSSSPAARRSTPTWAISGGGRSASAWFAVVLPALLLNYFGQGALLLHDPEAAREPVLPARAASWALYPLVVHRHRRGGHRLAGAHLRRVLAHAAGGAARLLPARDDRATPRATEGQIYIPEINWALVVACIALVLGFQTRRALAAAYGIAVTGTMAITTILFYRVARDLWRWPRGWVNRP